MNIQHVIPIADIQDHSYVYKFNDAMPVSLCSCEAKTIPDRCGGWIIVHGAFDGREAIEEFEEIIKKIK